jgi:hypothetical protein
MTHEPRLHPHRRSRRIWPALLLLAVSAFSAAHADEPAARPTQQQQIDALAAQLAAIQAQLRELLEQNKRLLERQQQLEEQVPASAQPAGAPRAAANPVPLPSNPVPPSNPLPPSAAGSPSAQSGYLPSPFGGLKLWGYGEAYYTHPTHDDERAQADLARAVFGIGYTFNDRTEFNSEFEVEHAVASAADVGEFEVEQFYVDRRLGDSVALRAGLFLMPFGFLNEHHEPTHFYGVQRNFIETLIIPSTWREGGLNLHGDTAAGFSWNAGLTTGFDLSKWSFAPQFPLYASALDLEDSGSAPLQATHQELALANAQHLSQYVALNYYGIPGLTVGGAISTGDAVKVAESPNAPIPGNQRVTLWEMHARWTPGPLDLSALYAHGAIGNLTLANAANSGSPNPIPSQFYGWYLQGAWQAFERGDYRLVPFVRLEYYDMGSSYEGTPGPVLPPGRVPLSANPGDSGYWPVQRDRVWTAGANFYLTPHVVFKVDYQTFDLNKDFTRIDLGLGLAF